MDLRDILNPADKEPRPYRSAPGDYNSQSTAATSASQATTAAKDDDDTISEVSTDVHDDYIFNTPGKHHRGSSDTAPSTVPSASRHARQVYIPPIVLSPSKGQVYNRRATTSPTRVPTLPSPPRRRRLIDRFEILLPIQESNMNHFSIFTALLNYAELTLEVAKNLNVEDLVSLYAISKDFHMLVNTRFTAMITAQWYCKASESGRTFIHRCYKNLCMRDPARRVNETKPSELRFVPSFRWLRMVLFREEVVDDIMRCMLREGHRFPRNTTLAIKKIWFTLDISDNARRIGLMHNIKFWTDTDLFLATMFFLKLDMRLTHPSTGNGEMGLRKMLLAQRSLSTLLRVLRREEMCTQLEMLRMIVRYNYEPEQHRGLSILGVPSHEVGKLQYEGWGAKETKFIQVDELVMREAIRRKMHLHMLYVDMMIWGYINKLTYQDMRAPVLPPWQEAESEDEGSDEPKGIGRERRFLVGDSSDEGGDSGAEGEKEEEVDFKKYGLSSKAKGKQPQRGRFRGSRRL